MLTLHYAWILDDAYVYFRYVDNWVLLDNGLVYNRGEYVEGFTSPAWLLLLALLRSAGLGWWWIVRGAGVACFALFWLALVVLGRRLSPREAPVVNVPLLWFSFHYGSLCYFTSGTEGPLVQLAAAATALFASRPASRGAQLALAVLPLVRPELVLATLAGALWLAARERRPPWLLLAAAAVLCGGWLAFRIVYYADLFPNTFYLKSVSNVGQGLAYLGDALLPYGFPWLLGAGLVLLVALARRRAVGHLSGRLFLLGVGMAITLWVVRIGGDARHYRYLVYPAALALCALAGVAEAALVTWAPRRRPLWAAAAGLSVLALSASGAPRQTRGHPIWLRDRPQLADGIDDAAHYRNHWGLPRLDPWSAEDPTGWTSDPAQVRRRLAERGYTRVDVGYVCAEQYRRPEQWAEQSLGLTEPFLARVDAPSLRPGHKWGLVQMARDLAAIHRARTGEPAPGMLRAAVEAGEAPAWIAANLPALEVVERKAYNRHDPIENLRLALTFPPRIPAPPPLAARREPTGAAPQPPAAGERPAAAD